VSLTDFETTVAEQGESFGSLFRQQWLPAAEGFIAQYCHQSFEVVEETRYYTGNDQSHLALGIYPIREVTACKLRLLPHEVWYVFAHPVNTNCTDERGVQIATPGDETALQSADLLVDCVSGILIIPPTILQIAMQAFLPGWNYTWRKTHDFSENITVTLEYGYDDDTRPAAIRTCAAYLCALSALPQIDAVMTAGIRQWRIGDESRTWAGAPGPVAGMAKEFMAFAYTGMYSPLAGQMLAYVAATLPHHRRIFMSG
jgi:hypothetical protein